MNFPTQTIGMKSERGIVTRNTVQRKLKTPTHSTSKQNVLAMQKAGEFNKLRPRRRHNATSLLHDTYGDVLQDKQ